MKKIIILLITLFTIQFVQAQAKITLIMNPRPIANISEWSNRRDVLTLLASPSPQGSMPNNVKINTIIKTADGTTVAVTDMLKAPVKPLVKNGNTIFYAGDVVNLQAMVFTGSYQSKLNKTGMLPAGTYQIIVELDSISLPIALSNTQTKVFFLAATQLPVLISPANKPLCCANGHYVPLDDPVAHAQRTPALPCTGIRSVEGTDTHAGPAQQPAPAGPGSIGHHPIHLEAATGLCRW